MVDLQWIHIAALTVAIDPLEFVRISLDEQDTPVIVGVAADSGCGKHDGPTAGVVLEKGLSYGESHGFLLVLGGY